MNSTDDASNEGRVTRARRKRLVSIDSEASSRPATPLSPERAIIGNLKIENGALPKRVTRRNSLSNTPQKTPAKIKENEVIDLGTPSTRTRRRSLSITDDNNTPQKLNKKQTNLTVLPEEDGKEKESDEKTEKRSAEKSEKRGRAKIPLENTSKPIRKTVRKLKKTILTESDYDSDIVEIVNIAENTDESQDGFEEDPMADPLDIKIEKPSLPNDITTENNTVACPYQTPNSKNSIMEDTSQSTVSLHNSKGILLKTEKNSIDMATEGTPNSSTAADDQSKSLRSKSVLFEKSENNSEELKTAYPKTPALRKKSSLLSASSGIVNKRRIELTDSMMEIEDDVFKENTENELDIVLESEKKNQTPNQKQFKITESNNSMISNSVKTPTPEKVLRSGKKYTSPPETEHNLSKEMKSTKDTTSWTVSKRSLHSSYDEKESTSNQSPKDVKRKDISAIQHQLSQSDSTTLTTDNISTDNFIEGNQEKSAGVHKDPHIDLSSPHETPPQEINPIEMQISNGSNKDKSNKTELQENAFTATNSEANDRNKENSANNQNLAESRKDTNVEKFTEPSISAKDVNEHQENLVVESKLRTSSSKDCSHISSPIKTLESKSPRAINLNFIEQKSKGQNQVNDRDKENSANNQNLAESRKDTNVEKIIEPSISSKDLNEHQENLVVESRLRTSSSKDCSHISSPIKTSESKSPRAINLNFIEQKSKGQNQAEERSNGVELQTNSLIATNSNDEKSRVAKNSEGTNVEKLTANDVDDRQEHLAVENQSFANAWIHSVKKSSFKIDTIECEAKNKSPQKSNNEKEIVEDKRDLTKNNSERNNEFNLRLQEESTDEDNNEDHNENSEAEEIQSFFNDEAEDMGSDYKSGDSMNEEERELDAENLSYDNGESIGSVDTTEDESEDDNSDENNSFFVPSDEDNMIFLEYSDDDEHLNDCNESSHDETTKKQIYKRIKKMSTDTEEDEQAVNFEVTHMIDDTMENDEPMSNTENKLCDLETNQTKSRSSRNNFFKEDSDVETEENYYAEAQKNGEPEKSRRSLIENSTIEVEEDHCVATHKKKLEKSRRSKNTSLTEDCEVESEDHNVEAQKNEPIEKSRRSRNTSSMEDNEEGNGEDHNVQTQKNEHSKKSRRSRNISSMEDKKIEDGENQSLQAPMKKSENSIRLRKISLKEDEVQNGGVEFVETQNIEKTARSRRSQNISLMESHAVKTEEDYNANVQQIEQTNKSYCTRNTSSIEVIEVAESPKKEKSKKSRSRNVSMMEDNDVENVVKHSFEVEEEKPNKSRRSRNTSLMEVIEVAESPNKEKSEKSRRSRNTSLMENNEKTKEKFEKSCRSGNISLMENNPVETKEDYNANVPQIEQTNKSCRTRNTSLIEVIEVAESPNREKSEKSRRSRNTSLMEDNEKTKEKFEKSRRSGNISLMEDFASSRRSQNISLKENNEVETEEGNDAEIKQTEQSKKSRHSRNISLMENNDFETGEEHCAEVALKRPDKSQCSLMEDNEVVIQEEHGSVGRKKQKSSDSNRFQNISLLENNEVDKPKTEMEKSVKSHHSSISFLMKNNDVCSEEEHKIPISNHSMNDEHFIESGNEPITPNEYKKRKHSVSLSNQKQYIINSEEPNSDDSVAVQSTKKIKLFDETATGKTVKIHAKNTSTPFINKKSNISLGTQQDISKILQRCNQILEETEKGKKNSKETKPPKEKKKKKVKSKITIEVNEGAPPLNGDDIVKRAALHQAIQASHNILTKPGKKRQRERLELQNDENKYESKRLPVEILTSLSPSTDVDSPHVPKKRKKNNFEAEKFVNVFKSTSGDVIVETPIEVPAQPKKIKTIKTATGEVCVEPISPLGKKLNNAGFRESPVSPHVSGWKMRLLNKPNIEANKNFQRKRRLAAIVEPTNILSQPTWTKSAGTFKIDKVEQTKTTQRIGSSEDKYGIPVATKKAQKQTSTLGLSAAERAMNFRENALYRENIPREDARSLLRRKRVFH